MKSKVCTKCLETFPATSEFFGYWKNNKGVKVLYSSCRKCKSKQCAEYNKNNRDKINKQRRDYYKTRNSKRSAYDLRLSNVYRKYKLREQDLRNLMDNQKGCCGICRRSLVNLKYHKQDLCIDHDHQTGEVRGLLCSMCNQMIGTARESEEILEKGKEYLRRYNGTPNDKI